MPLVTYSALRLGLLAACFAVGYWVGMRSWLLLVVAVLVAWALSYALLAGPRDAAAAYLASRAEARRRGDRRFPGAAADDAAHEDAVVDRGSDDVAGPARPRTADDADGLPPYGDDTARPRPSSTP